MVASGMMPMHVRSHSGKRELLVRCGGLVRQRVFSRCTRCMHDGIIPDATDPAVLSLKLLRHLLQYAVNAWPPSQLRVLRHLLFVQWPVQAEEPPAASIFAILW